jgi:putative ABC transport system permease protein
MTNTDRKIIKEYDLEMGRNFTELEITSGKPFVVIGQEIKKLMFGAENPLGKSLRIGSSRYSIIGVLKTKGSGMGFGGDKICIIPIQNARQNFSLPNPTFTVNVLCNNVQQMNVAIGEATGKFRQIRKVELGEGDNFEISKSEDRKSVV